MTAEAVADITDGTFASEVLERSREVPVVVDFWAPWCGPCRHLSPTLEQLAQEYAGKVRLVKVNIDENPAVAGRLGVQSIPAVMAFRDGDLVDQFVGALPEPDVRRFFESALPSPADLLVAKAAQSLAGGDVAAAERAYQSALAGDPRHADAALGLAALVLDQGDLPQAGALAEPWAGDARGKRILGSISLRLAAEGATRGELEECLRADERDAAAHYVLGALLAVEGEWDAALEHLLQTVRLDRAFADDDGRLRMLDAFNVLGDDDPLTQNYRRRLSAVLF